jgi:hypothetical protein
MTPTRRFVHDKDRQHQQPQVHFSGGWNSMPRRYIRSQLLRLQVYNANKLLFCNMSIRVGDSPGSKRFLKTYE